MIELRRYQEAGVAAFRAAFANGAKRVLYVAPTGSGKTVLFTHTVAGAQECHMNIAAQACGDYSVVVESFTPWTSHTLRGFVTVLVPEMNLRVLDLTLQAKGDSRWVGMPAKAQLDRDGIAKRDDRGEIDYRPVLQFIDRQTLAAFGERVIASLLEFAPSAFDPEDS